MYTTCCTVSLALLGFLWQLITSSPISFDVIKKTTKDHFSWSFSLVQFGRQWIFDANMANQSQDDESDYSDPPDFSNVQTFQMFLNPKVQQHRYVA